VSRISKLRSKRQEYNGKLEELSKQAVSLRNTDEYKKSAYEDLTCDLNSLLCCSAVVLGVCDLAKLLYSSCVVNPFPGNG
jgi:predicted nuclease with TOPRIM domain